MSQYRKPLVALILVLLLPVIDSYLPQDLVTSDLLRPIFIFAILGLGLNIVVGYTGLLNLGVAGFMAIGAYTYSILTCDIYPFRFGFWSAVPSAIVMGAVAGILLGLPTIRLRGDYLAIVTLGFGEIIQDSLKNLEVITKGIQSINPLPNPTVLKLRFEGIQPVFFAEALTAEDYRPWYYLFLAILLVAILLVRNLERSRFGRALISIREDELASSCMGIHPVKNKLLAFAFGASLCSLAGALYASHLGSSGEPGNYDFLVSVVALCIVIVGGMGSIPGVLLGAVVMIGFNSILLVKLNTFLMQQGLVSTENVFSQPNNWKYFIFGFALILTMRYRPEGLLPVSERKSRPEPEGEARSSQSSA